MRFQKYLNEKWLESFRGKFEVLENPSIRDLNELLKGSGYGRFILDGSKKKAWVWDGNEAVHQTVYNNLFITGKTIFGITKRIGGRWVMESSDEVASMMKYRDISYEEVIKILEDFSWANKYIDLKYFIKKLKEKIYG